MSETTAEVIILTINAIGAGMLVFVNGVVQKLMNQMDELEFKRFMNMLGKAAMSDPIAVTVATLPILAAVAYWIAFGFGHWWFTGFIVWGVLDQPSRRWSTCRFMSGLRTPTTPTGKT